MLFVLTSGVLAIQWVLLKPWSDEPWLGCVQRKVGAWAMKLCLGKQAVTTIWEVVAGVSSVSQAKFMVKSYEIQLIQRLTTS